MRLRSGFILTETLIASTTASFGTVPRCFSRNVSRNRLTRSSLINTSTISTIRSTRLASSTSTNENKEENGSVCAFTTNGYDPVNLIGQIDSAALFRSATLLDVDGKEVTLGDKLASSTDTDKASIVVFLRHLA